MTRSIIPRYLGLPPLNIILTVLGLGALICINFAETANPNPSFEYLSPLPAAVSRSLEYSDSNGTTIFSSTEIECPVPERKWRDSFTPIPWFTLGNYEIEIPPNFPSGILVSRQQFKNWAGDIRVQNVWTAAPRTSEEVVLIANWAVQNRYTLRPRGEMHSWSPVVLTPDSSSCGRLVLLDTTKYFTKMKMTSRDLEDGAAVVTVQPGVWLENLLSFLESNGFGIASHPSTGDLTIGGILAVGGHGTGLPIKGLSYASVSNLVVTLDAVVWNDVSQSFEIRSFNRSEPDTRALLVNLGRIFITEISLRVSPTIKMRCISRANVPDEELFHDPSTAGSSTRTVSKLLNTYGSLEVTSFPFARKPWLRLCHVSPVRPRFSNEVFFPYNYPLMSSLPEISNPFLKNFVAQNWKERTKFASNFGYLATMASTSDLWGPSKNLMLSIRSTTLQAAGIGYVVITSRANVQLVISQFVTFYKTLKAEFAEQNLYPVSGGIDIRISGLDNPNQVGINVPGAQAPSLSPLTPDPRHPDFDTGVWINTVSIPGTRNATNFMRKLEHFLLNNYPTSLANVRPEWSKGYAYTDTAGFQDKEILSRAFPRLFPDWEFAMSTFNKYDPKKVFQGTFFAVHLF